MSSRTLRAILCLAGILTLCTRDAQAGVGARLFAGSTQVANGDFYSAVNGGRGAPSSNMLIGGTLFGGSSKFEFGASWYTIPLQSSAGSRQIRSSCGHFLLGLTLRPLELGNLSGMRILAGFGMGVGYASTTLENKDYHGTFYQPEVTIHIPFSSSDEGQSRNGSFYPDMIFSLDVRAGARISNLETLSGTSYNSNGLPSIDMSGGFVSIGLSIFFNPKGM